MSNLAVKFDEEDPQKCLAPSLDTGGELRLVKSAERDSYVFFRHQLFAQYQHNDQYTRNLILVQLFLCHQVGQKELSQVFGLTVPHISSLVGKYRRAGSAGIEDRLRVRINNSLKIKGKIAKALTKQLALTDAARPSYGALSKAIKKQYGVSISRQRIGSWWSEQQQQKHESEKDQADPEQLALLSLPKQRTDETVSDDRKSAQGEREKSELVGEAWQINHVAGSFILYAMLEKSQFLKPFSKHIQDAKKTGRKCIERVMLSLFFMHALRLKSIEQTKHLLNAHFGPLVLGDFCRQQSLRYAVDDITGHKRFEQVVKQHYQQMGEQTELGDNIYYTDGHFSCYYGKYAIPKGYDARRQRPARGRNTIYLHNSLGHNILSFESPTNTTLNVDIETLLEKMQETYGGVKGKTLFFDRGGFSAKCFQAIKGKGMYFATYLKHRKKSREYDEGLFEEITLTLHGEAITNSVYETDRESKRYGTLRTIIFIGKRGKQIPVITTNMELSSAEIVARLQKRWVEENGFKYMGEHYNIDLLTTYKTEEAPDKIMVRRNPQRKDISREIARHQTELKGLKEQYTTRLREVKDKEGVTIKAFEEREQKLNTEIKTKELEIGLLKEERVSMPVKVFSNLKEESVISGQKRRMLINLVKTMNYNCEKWLQGLFVQYHPKADETLSLIRHVLTQPGRLRRRGEILEVELERLDSEVQANSLDKVLDNLKGNNCLRLPDGRELAIWQACRVL